MPTADPLTAVCAQCPRCQKWIEVKQWELEPSLVEVDGGTFAVQWFLKALFQCDGCSFDQWRAVGKVDSKHDTRQLVQLRREP